MTPYSPYKGKSGIKRIFNATGYSIAGFKAAFSHEAAFRQVLLLNLILIPISFSVDVSALEQALMVAVCLLAIIVELFNSAIEAVVDRISEPYRVCRRVNILRDYPDDKTKLYPRN